MRKVLSTWILGATPKDTEIGLAICRSMGLEIKAIHISSNPSEQALLHTYNLPELERKVINLIMQNKIEHLIVFCNSLSFSLNWDIVGKRTKCKIYDLKMVYGKMATQKKEIMILATDCITLERMTNFILKISPKIVVRGFALFPLVEYSETDSRAAKLIIADLIELTRKIGMNTFIIGCTHFETNILEIADDIEIIYPGRMLIQYYKEKLYSKK